MQEVEYIFIIWEKEAGFFGKELKSAWIDKNKAVNLTEQYRLKNKAYRYWVQTLKISS